MLQKPKTEIMKNFYVIYESELDPSLFKFGIEQLGHFYSLHHVA